MERNFSEVLENLLIAVEGTSNFNSIAKIERIYKTSLPNEIKKLIASNNEPVFLNNGSRILSLSEIIDAEKDLQVNFTSLGLIPIADCGENDFVVYIIAEKTYAKFNINSETLFKKESNIFKLIK